jgi:hypothetical protein
MEFSGVGSFLPALQIVEQLLATQTYSAANRKAPVGLTAALISFE